MFELQITTISSSSSHDVHLLSIGLVNERSTAVTAAGAMVTLRAHTDDAIIAENIIFIILLLLPL